MNRWLEEKQQEKEQSKEDDYSMEFENILAAYPELMNETTMVPKKSIQGESTSTSYGWMKMPAMVNHNNNELVENINEIRAGQFSFSNYPERNANDQSINKEKGKDICLDFHRLQLDPAPTTGWTMYPNRGVIEMECQQKGLLKRSRREMGGILAGENPQNMLRTREEPRNFPGGLEKHENVRCKSISNEFAVTRSPSQVASHALKFHTSHNHYNELIQGINERPAKKKEYGHWKEEEQRNFLRGLKKYGRNWKDISQEFVATRTPTQVGSHAQKFFIHQNQTKEGKGKKRRGSIYDITDDGMNIETNTPLDQEKPNYQFNNSSNMASQQHETTMDGRIETSTLTDQANNKALPFDDSSSIHSQQHQEDKTLPLSEQDKPNYPFNNSSNMASRQHETTMDGRIETSTLIDQANKALPYSDSSSMHSQQHGDKTLPFSETSNKKFQDVVIPSSIAENLAWQGQDHFNGGYDSDYAPSVDEIFGQPANSNFTKTPKDSNA